MRVLALALLLAGCMTQGEVEDRTDEAFALCAGAGLVPGTPAHLDCVRREVNIQPSYRRPEVTRCTSDFYGGVRCVTR